MFVGYLILLILSTASECFSQTTEETEVEAPVVVEAPVANSALGGLKSYLNWSSDPIRLHAHHEPRQDKEDQQDPAEERAFHGLSFGWTVSTAILIFAFANTIIIGGTLVVSYAFYQLIVSVLAVVAPAMAKTFVGLVDFVG